MAARTTISAGQPKGWLAPLALQAPFDGERLVGSSGAWAWTTPNQLDPTRTGLAPNLALQVVDDRGDRLLVRTQSGWCGWTGAPYLVPVGGAPGASSPGSGPLPHAPLSQLRIP